MICAHTENKVFHATVLLLSSNNFQASLWPKMITSNVIYVIIV